MLFDEQLSRAFLSRAMESMAAVSDRCSLSSFLRAVRHCLVGSAPAAPGDGAADCAAASGAKAAANRMATNGKMDGIEGLQGLPAVEGPEADTALTSLAKA